MLLKCNIFRASFLHHITNTDSMYGHAHICLKLEALLNNAFNASLLFIIISRQGMRCVAVKNYFIVFRLNRFLCCQNVTNDPNCQTTKAPTTLGTTTTAQTTSLPSTTHTTTSLPSTTHTTTTEEPTSKQQTPRQTTTETVTSGSSTTSTG